MSIPHTGLTKRHPQPTSEHAKTGPAPEPVRYVRVLDSIRNSTRSPNEKRSLTLHSSPTTAYGGHGDHPRERSPRTFSPPSSPTSIVSPANKGISDKIYAPEWVSKHIKHFY